VTISKIVKSLKPWKPPAGVKLLAGVDEVGRGPLAGDVVTAAVILPVGHRIEGLTDSKALSARQRENLYKDIISHASSWCIGRASVEEIDRFNILQATLMAMRRAVMGLKIQPDYIAVDGNRLPQWEYRGEAVVKGDGRVEVISAASILAKWCATRRCSKWMENTQAMVLTAINAMALPSILRRCRDWVQPLFIGAHLHR